MFLRKARERGSHMRIQLVWSNLLSHVRTVISACTLMGLNVRTIWIHSKVTVDEDDLDDEDAEEGEPGDEGVTHRWPMIRKAPRGHRRKDREAKKAPSPQAKWKEARCRKTS